MAVFKVYTSRALRAGFGHLPEYHWLHLRPMTVQHKGYKSLTFLPQLLKLCSTFHSPEHPARSVWVWAPGKTTSVLGSAPCPILFPSVPFMYRNVVSPAAQKSYLRVGFWETNLWQSPLGSSVAESTLSEKPKWKTWGSASVTCHPPWIKHLSVTPLLIWIRAEEHGNPICLWISWVGNLPHLVFSTSFKVLMNIVNTQNVFSHCSDNAWQGILLGRMASYFRV